MKTIKKRLEETEEFDFEEDIPLPLEIDVVKLRQLEELINDGYDFATAHFKVYY